MSLFVSPAGSNFVDLRKGHGRTSFVSLVAGHVWWRRIFQCPKRESRINLLLYINWRLTQHHWVFTYPKVEKNNLSVEVSGRRHIALAFWLTFEQWKGIKFTDVFGYIYTSGTTGLPKAPRSGVLTTSKVSILSNFWGKNQQFAPMLSFQMLSHLCAGMVSQIPTGRSTQSLLNDKYDKCIAEPSISTTTETPLNSPLYSILLICSKNGCSFWSPWQAAKVTHARMYGLGGIGRLLGLGPGRWSLVDWSGQNITVLLSTLEGAV